MSASPGLRNGGAVNGFSIFGIIVFVAVMIPVLFPFSVSLGRPLTRLLRRTFLKLRMMDPPRLPAQRGDQRPLSTDQTRTNHPRDLPPSEAGPLPIQTPAIDDCKSWRVRIDLTLSPPVGVLLLLITRTIDGTVLRQAVLGTGSSRPYDVLVLFISLAYIATALDSTGALRALAFYVSQRSGRSGPRLYLLLYIFFFSCGVIFGNDPIILSGTAFLTYFTRVAGITPPTAWIFMEFVAANVASAVLVSSNPTNILIAQAFDLNFLTGFTKYTVLPSLVAAVFALPLLYGIFSIASIGDKSAYIPARLDPPDVHPRSALVDPSGALFHTSLMLATLAALVGTSFVHGAEVWMVTMPAGVIALSRDIYHDVVYHKTSNKRIGRAEEPSNLAGLAGLCERAINELSKSGNDSDAQKNKAGSGKDGRSVPAPLSGRADSPTARYPPSSTMASPLPLPSRKSLPAVLRSLQLVFPTTTSTISRLPIPLLPFALAMFILVRSLVYLGWVSIFAGWLEKICVNPAATVFFIGFLGSLVLCPLVGTNIGATILLVEILTDPKFQNSARVQEDPRILRAAIFSTALASNIGAFSFTFAASLAGLLWVSILKQKHIIVSAKAFALWNFIPVVVLTFLAMCTVLVEILYF